MVADACPGCNSFMHSELRNDPNRKGHGEHGEQRPQADRNGDGYYQKASAPHVVAEEHVAVGEAVGQLKVGLARLKALDRLTLEAFYLRGRSLKQMAREFEVPTGGTDEANFDIQTRRASKS